MQFFLSDENATQNLAKSFSEFVQKGQIIFLRGDLGVGKSSFARYFIREKMSDPELDVVSPTFSLVQFYESADAELVHADLYRLKSEDELLELSLHDYLLNGILLIEWPEIAQNFLPQPDYDLFFSIHGNGRYVKIQSNNTALTEQLQRNFT